DNAQHYPADSTRGRPTFDEFDPDRDFDRIDDWTLYTWGVYHTPALPGKERGLLREPPDYFFRTIDLVKQQVGDTVSVHGEVFSPFTHLDRKSTRLNSSHVKISYAVFCLTK